MTVDVVVPAVGESITEVQIGEWFLTEGDWIRQDESLVVIETEKATVELPAPVSGVLVRILKPKGASARVGETIGRMEESEKPAGRSREREAESAGRVPPAESPAPSTVTAPRVMPAARRALEERRLSPAEVRATGPGGRLLKEDVEREPPIPRPVGQPPAVAPLPKEPPSAESVQAATDSRPAATGRGEEVVPMTLIRRRIAERLVAAKQNAALLTTFNEIDMSAVQQLRSQYREAFQERYGVKLGFMSFFVKAVVEALKRIPQLNAEIRGSDIVYKNYYDIGVAVGGGRGLVVPILRNADQMSFSEVEKAIADFAKRAQENTLRPEDLQGGTFTISNGGVYGSLLSTPIVNPPQSGILGLHAVQERAVVRDGRVVVRPMMYVALTYDHRLVDGREAVTFLRRVKDVMENPAAMLLEV
ncbi:MAG: 2-oxoglutarate dehydrogenase complex dihydrolipoyllysine-residue succinyltransferase [Nitrospirae bacterium]|nr:2-oxoglutarate dehydrogenase complex dihydrolipoyllysine-residue succinyltransferase [Nitrospirota bacterium]